MSDWILKQNTVVDSMSYMEMNIKTDILHEIKYLLRNKKLMPQKVSLFKFEKYWYQHNNMLSESGCLHL